MKISGSAIATFIAAMIGFGASTAGVQSAVAADAAAAADATSAADTEAINTHSALYAKRFKEGDAAGLADMWTESGIWVDEEGIEHHGRAEIKRTFERFFATHPRQKLLITMDSLQFLSPDVAIEHGKASALQSDSWDSAQSSSNYVVMHLKQNGEWHMAMVVEPLTVPPPVSLNDLGWLAGDWTATGAGGEMHVKGAWQPGHHYLKFNALDPDKSSDQPQDQYQLIGWNPLEKSIVSWHFNSNGAFGQGIWTSDGDRWIEHAIGILPNGQKSSADYVIHKISDDKFTWQSVNRKIASVPIPDTRLVTVVRDAKSN